MGTLNLASPLGAFREEQTMSRHRVSPSPFLSSSSHTTQLHHTNSYTYSHPNLNFLQHCTDARSTRNVVCPSGAWFENRPHSTPSIRLAWNSKHVIARCVGIGTHTLKQKITLYTSLIRSIITYAIPPWGYTLQWHMKLLQTVRNKAAWFITGADIRTPVTQLHDSLDPQFITDVITNIARRQKQCSINHTNVYSMEGK